MKISFYRVVVLLTGPALLMDGLALADFLFHPLAQDYIFHSIFYRAVNALLLMPFTLVVGFLIIKRVPGNLVGPLLILWSGTVAHHSIREAIGPGLFSLYYAYDIVFGWYALFLLLLHFPDGKIYPPAMAGWIYSLLLPEFICANLIFLSANPLEVPSRAQNVFALPGLLPYDWLILTLSLIFFAPILLAIPISFALRYRKGSLLERQQIKWLALFGGILAIFTSLGLILYPLLVNRKVMDAGTGWSGMLFYLISGLFPALAIGIAILRYRLWDIDRIIRRTLVYSILTAALALIYFGSVAILQALLGFVFKLGSGNLPIALSTLAIAAAFTPLRVRIQRGIDRRFYRQKYDAESLVQEFSVRLRGGADLKEIHQELVAVTQEALQPEQMALWMRVVEKR